MPDMTFIDAVQISCKAYEMCKGRVCTDCPFDQESRDCRITSNNFLSPAEILDLYASLVEVKDLIDKDMRKRNND